MTLAVRVKKKVLGLKYWLVGYTKEERLARLTLSNHGDDSTKEIGLLIAAAFMTNAFMAASLRTAFRRLQARDSKLFPKCIQYHKALLFLQKVCMQSGLARDEIRRQYLRILPFAFYNKGHAELALSIRVLSISILKLVNNSEAARASSTATTFITCQSRRQTGHSQETTKQLNS